MHIKNIYIISIVTLIFVLVSFYKTSESRILKRNENIYAVGIDQNIIYYDIKKEYEITIDSFNIVQNRIKRNQNLAKLLVDAGLEYSKVEKATRQSAEVFDIRRIKAGNYYRLYYAKDSSKTLSYFVYKHSPTEYLKIALNNVPSAIKGKKEIVSIRKSSSGTISSSLWATMIENNIDPMMANRLSEIYAWTVDFFGLEQGDQFKVIYDEQFVDSISIGIGEIYAASFNHRGEELLAYEFEQNGVKSFFDEKGKSLRRQFLKSPLRFSRISSGYSNSRMHPILKIRRPHRGVDYAAPTGTPINSIGDGTVYKKGYTKSAGYYIKIRHNSVYTSGYNHLSRYPKGIKVGQRVTQGQIVGYVGSTGYATGPHLDFRVWKNGQATDPLKIKAPPVEPIAEQNITAFKKSKQELKDELEKTNS
ncbi:MAG: peptidoglycan DD-metalloendopeptidase family protein [Bacteroidales bacterium]|jgi:murein DD-endopeptidase MepM/ murein hydrolase activator NlpD|nr:peptidoglycan DD-metalloendopeptidase family protein [Bacteroidales bacterium]